MLEIVARLVLLLALRSALPMYILLLIDNEPAGHALTKGFGNCKNLNRLPQVAWWPVRQPVMSSANVSDGVSRFDFAFAEKHGWEWCSSKYALF